MAEETRQAPRKRPGATEEQTRQGPPRRAPRITPTPKSKLDEPVESKEGEGKPTLDEGIRKLPRPGEPDTQSRAKAERSADRATRQQPEERWPTTPDGRPLTRIEFSASELIPTGQYANVSVGPARITTFIDPLRAVEEGESYFQAGERENIVKAMNELAEMVEGEVVAVQRNIVLESIQEQLSNGSGS